MKIRYSLFIYVVVSLALLPFYQHDIGPDAISYITIANKYASLSFTDAINGYWSPLISWLLVPFVLCGIPAFLSFKLILIGFGYLAYREFIYILHNKEVKADSGIKKVIEFGAQPLFYYFSVGSLSPDILSVFFLLKYLHIVAFAPDKMYKPLLLGTVCAFACFSKSYTLIFILLHFTYTFFFIKKSGKSWLSGYITPLVLICFLVSPWIVALSMKYNKFTFSTAAAYNFAIIGPEAKWHPALSDGLSEPPNTTATSSWEDPSFIPVAKWSPVETSDHFIFFIKHCFRMVFRFVKYYLSYLPLLATLLLVCFRFLFRRAALSTFEKILISFLIYPFFYFLILVEERYVWIIHLVLLLYSGYLLSTLLQLRYLKKARMILLVLFVSGIIYTPLKMLYYTYNYSRTQKLTATEIKNKPYLNNSRIAAQSDLYNNALYICWYSKATFLGGTKKEMKDFTTLQSELQKFKTNYYIAPENAYFKDHEISSVNTFQGKLFIYRVD